MNYWKLNGNKGTIEPSSPTTITVTFDDGTKHTYPLTELPEWVEKMQIYKDNSGGIIIGNFNE